MATSVGFRPPQLSEDSAWLPPWLQNHQLQSSSSAAAASEHHQTPRDSLVWNDQGGYNGCRLFLSAGEDASQQLSVEDSTPANALHLRLRFSSDGDSLCGETQVSNSSQFLPGCDKVSSSQHLENSAWLGDENHKAKVDDNVGAGVKLTHLASVPMEDKPREDFGRGKMASNIGRDPWLLASAPTRERNVGPLSHSSCKDGGGQRKGKFNARNIKDDEINNAVELSIAASEALVTHELVKTDSASEALPMEAILEAALHVKQARQEMSGNTLHCLSVETDDADSLSDLDDSIMVDTFRDVGLCFPCGFDDNHPCSLDISKVEDTPVSGNKYDQDDEPNCVRLMAQEVGISYHSPVNSNAFNKAGPGDSISHLPAQEILHLSSMAQPYVDGSSSHVGISKNAGEFVNFFSSAVPPLKPFKVPPLASLFLPPADREDKICNFTAERCGNCLLGSWGEKKKADDSTKLKTNIAGNIPTFFIGQTSILSESADAAPDKNSFVEKHDNRIKIGSQSSIHFEGLNNGADEGISESQEVKSSNLSLVDPLCSVVPCSISLENSGSPLALDQNGVVVDAEECFHSNSMLGMEYFQRYSDVNVEPVHIDSQVIPTAIRKTPARRRLASLRTYGTLLPKLDDTLKGRRLCHNQNFTLEFVGDLHSSDHEVGCRKSPDRINSKGIKPFTSEFGCSIDGYDGQYQGVNVIGDPVDSATNPKRSDEKTAKGGAELHDQLSVQRGSPLILNRRRRCCPQVQNLTGDETHEYTMEQKATLKLHQRESHRLHSRSKKRVHFSEFEVELPHKNPRGPQTLQSNYANTRHNKKSKSSNLQLGFQSQDTRSYFTVPSKDERTLVFHGLEFLLTGFSRQKEEEIMGLIQKNGGIVLFDVPSPPDTKAKATSRSNVQQLPIVICLKKLQTTKFLYGCAVKALILKVKWLTDSIAAGSAVLPRKYMILPNQLHPKCSLIGKPVRLHKQSLIFDRVGIMLHGKQNFCTKLAIIIKHGGGQVIKTLQRLFRSLENQNISVGVIVAEDHSRAFRHLRHCASERKIPMMPASWIAKSLHLGKILPFKEKDKPVVNQLPEIADSLDWSQEI